MTQYGQHTLGEILSEPDAWDAAVRQINAQVESLRHFYRDGQYESVIFTGCGSTYYLSISAAALFQQLGVADARALPASEIWLYPQSAFSSKRRTLLIAISRSGETTETVRAVKSFLGGKHGDVVTLSCYPERALATMGSVNIVLPSGQEESIAQTRAFTVLYLGVTALAALWSDQHDMLHGLQELGAAGHRLFLQYAALAQNYGEDASLERFYFLGSGVRYGLAAELSLKMKEMSLSHSEPFHFMEFRHGPQSMVTDNTLIVGLVSDTNRSAETRVLSEMRQRGAKILSIGENDADVAFDSNLPEAIRGVLYLPVGQIMAFHRAIMRGLDPDRPHNLAAVVRLDDHAGEMAKLS